MLQTTKCINQMAWQVQFALGKDLHHQALMVVNAPSLGSTNHADCISKAFLEQACFEEQADLWFTQACTTPFLTSPLVDCHLTSIKRKFVETKVAYL